MVLCPDRRLVGAGRRMQPLFVGRGPQPQPLPLAYFRLGLRPSTAADGRCGLCHSPLGPEESAASDCGKNPVVIHTTEHDTSLHSRNMAIS